MRTLFIAPTLAVSVVALAFVGMTSTTATATTTATDTFLRSNDNKTRTPMSIYITGTVTAPPGHTVEGLVARQCVNACQWHQDYPIRGTGRIGVFAIQGNPDNEYEILFNKDVNGPDDGPGDLYGRVPYIVRTGTGNHHVRLYEFSQMRKAIDAELRGEKPQWPGEKPGDMNTTPPFGITGAFRHFSKGKKIAGKGTVTTTAAIAAGPQGILTGSGAGQMVTTVGSKKVAQNGTWEVDLAFAKDGTFKWILNSDVEEEKCRIRIREEKVGRSVVNGNNVILHAVEGTQTYHDSCMTGPSTHKVESEMEEYTLTKAGNGFVLKGGPDEVNWRFDPR